MSSDPFATPAGDPPQFGQPPAQYGGQPGYGSPTYAQPTYAQPTYPQPPAQQLRYGPQPGYGQPAYGQPYGGGYGAPARNGMGVTALVLGIVSIFLCWTVAVGIIGGLLALIFGILGRKRAGRGEATNGGLALAGAITGVFGIIFGGGLLAVYIYFGGSLSQLGRCDRAANGDQQQIQLCNDQFQNRVNT